MINYKLENEKMLDGLSRLNKELISLLQFENKEMSTYYTFETYIPIIIDLEKGIPKHTNSIIFRLELSEKSVKEPYLCTFLGKNKPFHPHVKKGKLQLITKKARWVDFPLVLPERSLFQFLIKILKSLQFQDDYIYQDAENIGNKNALNWYNHIKDKTPHYFPIDNSELFDNSKIPQSKEIKVSSLPNKKFSIQSQTEKYQPEVRTKESFETVEKLNANFQRKKYSHELYLEYKAHKTIFNHINWGKKTKKNRVEQGGILIGNVYFDEKQNLTYGLVEKAIPALGTEGSSTHLRLNHENWKRILDEIDNQSADDSEQIIGWYHTHPNHLDVFMSEVDRTTQKQFFPNNWQFAMVLNPHKQIWKVFHGKRVNECKGFVLKTNLNNKDTNEDLTKVEVTLPENTNEDEGIIRKSIWSIPLVFRQSYLNIFLLMFAICSLILLFFKMILKII